VTETPGALIAAEIAEQGEVWARLAHSPEIDRAAAFVAKVAPRVIVLAARGTIDHAAIYGQYLAQAKLAVPSFLATPGLATLFDVASFPCGSLLIVLSQSGASPDLLATISAARAEGIPTLAITNNLDSPLAQGADHHLDLDTGPENSVAATKSYTVELVALYCLVEQLREGGASTARGTIAVLADTFEKRIPSLTEHADALVASIADSDRALIVGRGFSFATAKEGALKLMETSARVASGWSAADAKHGPLGQVVEGTQ
jgi:glucosamine--fructose-6-phosphate aminotransferase (isomerizing)